MILEGTLNWALGFISLDRLLESLEKSEVSPLILADLDPGKMLYLPASLEKKMILRITRIADVLGASQAMV